MTLRKFSIMAAAIATVHLFLLLAVLFGVLVFAIDSASPLSDGGDALLTFVSNALLEPIGLLWRPSTHTSWLPVCVGVVANSTLFGVSIASLIALLDAVIPRGSNKRSTQRSAAAGRRST